MNYTFKMIRRVAGKNIKSLYLPIVLSCVDALLHMGMFSTMIMTIIELIGGVFTMQRLTLYGVILVLLFLMRAILFSINYTQVQYRGADISAQQRLSLGDHIRSLNLGYFNKNSIGRLMSTLTTDITDFEQVLTHSLASLISLSSMMATLGSLYPELKYLSKAAENILQVRQEAPLPYREDAAQLNAFDVSFSHVNFAYEKNVPVLHDVSFSVKPGTTTALVGPSGSGKTTIISLISRFWDVSKGSITIGGSDIREQSPDVLTGKMAIVFQDVYLLHDTIANNIRVGKPGASMEEIIAVAKAAQCHEFISALPDGYDTVVGEGGNTLSGGEKQRISIARALIKDAPIVLLDETTSSLDADNEKEIHRALDALMKDKTVIVIAHRLNTIIGADQILVLDEGIICERGNHKELLAQNGWYARMISEQTKAREWSIT